MNPTKPLRWSSAALTHVGMVRKLNEDAYLTRPNLGLWVVADGMGGHAAGEVASGIIVDTLGRMTAATDWQTFVAETQQSLREANRRIRQESAQHYQHRTIGSTAVALIVHGHQGACLWVGDSRLYRLRDRSLRQLSRDHSHVQDLVDQGLLTPEQANAHPLSNVITRALGSEESPNIDMRHFALLPGDVYLLCSDGLSKTLSDAEIAGMLASSQNSQVIAQALIHSALVRQADDNVTVVVVNIREENDDVSDSDNSDATIPMNLSLI